MKLIDRLIRESAVNTPEVPESINEKLISDFSARPAVRRRFPKLVAAIAVPAVLAMTGAGVYAAVSGGYFKDVKNDFGAVTGTVYENATDEISVNAELSGHDLKLSLTFLAPDSYPYKLPGSEIGLMDYRIIRKSDNTEIPHGEAIVSGISEGFAELVVPLDDIRSGNHAIIIDSFVITKKADQPLPVKGSWSVDFTAD